MRVMRECTMVLSWSETKCEHRFYAVNINDLQDRPGFPVIIDGRSADNDNARYFIGGTTMQRTASLPSNLEWPRGTLTVS